MKFKKIKPFFKLLTFLFHQLVQINFGISCFVLPFGQRTTVVLSTNWFEVTPLSHATYARQHFVCFQKFRAQLYRLQKKLLLFRFTVIDILLAVQNQISTHFVLSFCLLQFFFINPTGRHLIPFHTSVMVMNKTSGVFDHSLCAMSAETCNMQKIYNISKLSTSLEF